MTRAIRVRAFVTAAFAAVIWNACSTEDGPSIGGGQEGGTTGDGAGGSQSGTAGDGTTGSAGAAGVTGGGAGQGGGADGSVTLFEAGRDGDNQPDRSIVTDGSAASDAGLDRVGFPEGGGTIPLCITEDVAGGVNRASMNYIECDVEDQAIDFDVAANYPAPRKPGYDPSITPVTLTAFGTGFTGFAVQQCHPYCYRANLTIGIDFIAGSDATLRGEAIFDFPPTVAPIANAVNRASLGWLYVDGPPLPAGTTLTAQMVLKSTSKGILLANGTKAAPPKTWVEFKYFPIQQGFNAADLVDITSIGFRLTLSPTASAKDWHGVVYADHFQLRK
jgi:hypothetical protein